MNDLYQPCRLPIKMPDSVSDELISLYDRDDQK